MRIKEHNSQKDFKVCTPLAKKKGGRWKRRSPDPQRREPVISPHKAKRPENKSSKGWPEHFLARVRKHHRKREKAREKAEKPNSKNNQRNLSQSVARKGENVAGRVRGGLEKHFPRHQYDGEKTTRKHLKRSKGGEKVRFIKGQAFPQDRGILA